ncbi:MAG: ABC transporter permease [Chloroflexi bacterium]|nr:ABC transporter permease [Chloroflexota bacterium]MCI0647933.1 ABC transporter permease [Chloroflexota bacterium]MCI0727184.1 ABC transporter permease [Chloroflexota bacterium]
MIQYSVRRIFSSIPVILGVVLVTFLLARLIPGDPCHSLLGERATAEACERFNRAKGLDQPMIVQLGIYARDMARGDFGDSIRFNRPVTTIVLERLPLTVELSLASIAIAMAVGVTLGIISATRRNSLVDVVTMAGANIGVSMPVFWLGLMLAYLFALVLRDTPFALPPSGRLSPGVIPEPFYEVYGWTKPESGLLATLATFVSNMFTINALLAMDWGVLKDTIVHLILPSVALSTIPLSIIARMTRSSMLEVLEQDYVRTAKAKGLPQQQVVMKHAFRNALLPIVTIVGLQFGLVLSGAILTETIFNLAGVGRAVYEAITARDYPIIQGFVIVISVGYVLLNLLVDLSYAFLDPRIRLD